ncbi:ribonuclease HI [Kocuria indica]|uniref:RNase H family protein n=1 Tax=Kocuria marina TaxID=223184 RepID=UPI001EF47EC7|nr:RNase H family protein [Kocuria indica]MCG7431945.1 ribonuclease HI [Kocuria indica]
MTIIASADGSALGNPGPAGWAWYIDPTSWRAGGWAHGTNNMGELTAVLDLLRSTRHRADEPLRVLCDSQYVINSVTKWMPGWKKKGWKKRDGKPVLNVEIMKALDRELSGRDVSFEWVKGHAGHELNEAADERARAMATAYQSGTAPEDMPAGPGFQDDAGRGIEAGDVEPDLFSAWASPEDLPAGHAGSADSADSTDSNGTPEHLISDAASREATVLGRGNAPGGPGESLHPDLVCVDRRGATTAPESVLSIVEAAGCEPRELRVTALGAHAYHVSYRLEETSVVTRRSSVWVREDQHHDMGPWLLRYHQVTAEV